MFTKRRIGLGVALLASTMLLVACGGGGGGGTTTPVATAAHHGYAGNGGDYGDVTGTVYPEYVQDAGLPVSLKVDGITSSTSATATTKTTVEGAGCYISNAGSTSTESIDLNIYSDQAGDCIVKTTDKNGTAVLAETSITFVDATNRTIWYNPWNNLVLNHEAPSNTSTVAGCGGSFTIDVLNEAKNSTVAEITRLGSVVMSAGPHTGSALCLAQVNLPDDNNPDVFRNRWLIAGVSSGENFSGTITASAIASSERSLISIDSYSASFTNSRPDSSDPNSRFSFGNGKLQPGGRDFDTGYQLIEGLNSYSDEHISLSNSFVFQGYAQVDTLGGRSEKLFVLEINSDGSSKLPMFLNLE